MKYYSEKELAAIFSNEEMNTIDNFCTPIKVQFCRDCPMFVPNGVQLDYPTIKGYCKHLSYDEPEEGEYPYYIHVTANDFCNKDSIKDEVL